MLSAPSVRARLNATLGHGAARALLIVACLIPLTGWFAAGAQDRLGANPAETLLRGTGHWTLYFLLATLAVTPLRTWAGLAGLARWRRILGLACFGYACLHALAYGWLDMGLDPASIARDLGKRPFALVGFAAWVLLVPLAATSWNGAIRALGGKRWQALHRLVFPIAGLSLLHFLWMRAAKQRAFEIWPEALVLAVLLLARVLTWARERHRTPQDRRQSRVYPQS